MRCSTENARQTSLCARLTGLGLAGIFLFLAPTTDAQFVLVDDFEELNPGVVHGQNGWFSSTSAATVAADPTQAGNQALRIDTIFSTQHIRKAGAIRYPDTGTLFFRMWRASKINFSMGMTDVTVPGNNFNSYAAQVNCNSEGPGNLRVRAGGSFLPVETFDMDTWYDVWMVINTVTDSYRVYLQGGGLAGPTLLDSGGITDFKFRNSSGTTVRNHDMVNVLIMFAGGDGGHAGPIVIDDIYLDSENSNLAHPLFGDVDPEPPAVLSVDPSQGEINALTQITVTFSKPVTGIQAEDLLVDSLPALSVIGSGAVYTFEIEQPPYGPVRISWEPDHVIRDFALPPNRFDETAPGAQWEYDLVDVIPPEVVLLNPPPEVTVRGFSQLEVTFSESVQGVTAAALLVNGLPASSLTVLDEARYVFGFVEPPPGTVSLSWAPDHGITDLAAVPNAFAGGSWSCTLDPDLTFSGIRINEFLASNRNGLLDEDGDAEDWIELYNQGSEVMTLYGWSLTDDADASGQWVFPPVVIGPGEYLVVFASGKDRKPADGSPLHTNFRLAGGGEYLGLYNSESPREVVSELAPAFPEQRTDYSYGFDSAGELRYFAGPTPGGPNGDSDIIEIAQEPQFSVERGLFDEPFHVSLSTATQGALIRYTLDGSEPTKETPDIFGRPLHITETTTLRAVTFKPGALPSHPVTHTYIFPAQVIRQPNEPEGFPSTWGTANGFPDNIIPAHYEMYPGIVDHPDYGPQMEEALRSLPAVSIVTDVDDMFGPTKGIYSHSRESRSIYRGRDWERSASVELIPGPGEQGFQVNCGIRIHGNASREPRKNPKHSFRLYFRRDYGPSRLQEKVFPESPVGSFKQLVLRGDFNNSWLHWLPAQRERGTRIRDGWTKESWRDMGHHGSHTRYVHLYINGLYWGIYDFGERIDATFAASYFGGGPEDYDAMASKPTRAIDGDQTAYNAMVSAVRFPDMSVLANYEGAHEHLDVTNYIDYMLLNFYGGNEDWHHDSNWNAVRRRDPPGLYKYIPWDCEQLLTSPSYNRVSDARVPSHLHTNLVGSAEYRLAFADRVQKHLFNDGALTVPAATQRWLKHAATLETAIMAESARWGNYRRDVHPHESDPYEWYTPNTHWQPEINRVANTYFPQRHGIFIQQLRDAGLYPDIDAPQLSRHGGAVRSDTTIEISAPAGTIYYTTNGDDPRVFGTGAVSESAQAYAGAVPIGGRVALKARALQGGEWSALTEATFDLTAPAPYPLGEAGPYFLAAWNAEEPSGSYPPHILFYQTAVQDPGLEVEMDSVWSLPYNLTSRSRVMGLGGEGFAFINTSNPQDVEGAGYLGAAVLALNTLGQEDIYVTWTGGTVIPNSRAYGIRLQFRASPGEAFQDVLNESDEPVEYIRNEAGHFERIGPVKLPSAAEDQPLVELRWKYYYISGESGARAMLRIEGIQVSAGHPAAAALEFAEMPVSAQTGRAFGPVIVQARTGDGLLATGYNGIVEVSVAGQSGALSGTVNRPADGGIAYFDDLAFNSYGLKTLTASGEGLAAGESREIRVVDLTEVILPRYIQGEQPENNNRVPFAFRLSVAGLKANATYRYGNRIIVTEDSPDQNGAGNMIFVRNGGNFIRNTDAPRFQPGDLDVRHGEFVTDAEGRYTGWFITEPSGNWRLTPGGIVFPRLILNDGAGGDDYFHYLTASTPVEVIAFGPGENQASALYATSAAADRNFVVLYGDAAGASRPLSATVIEATGAQVDWRYAGFYEAVVANRSGRWGTLVPNGLEGGVRRIEERDLLSGDIVSAFVAPGGILPTRDMTGGANAAGIRVPGPEDSGYTIWQSRQFTLGELANEIISGPGADPLQSGFPNLLRYASGLDLADAGEPALPTAHLDETAGDYYLAFRHRRLIAESDLEYAIEISIDLNGWTDATGELIEVQEAEPAGDGLTEIVTWLLPIDNLEAQQFLRLRVRLP